MTQVRETSAKQVMTEDCDNFHGGSTQTGGLPIRTDLRAGLAENEMTDQVAALLQQMMNYMNGGPTGTETVSQ